MTDVIDNEVSQYEVYCDDEYLEIPETIEISDDVVATLYAYIERTRAVLEQNSAIAMEIKVDVPYRFLDENDNEFKNVLWHNWNYTVLRVERYTPKLEFGSGSTKIWICI